ANMKESLRSTLALQDERTVARIGVREEEAGTVRVGPRNEDCRHAEHVRGEPRRRQSANELTGGHEDLTAKMPTLLLRCRLILEVDACRAGLDQRFHQLERIERPAEPRLRIGDDRREPV